MSQRIFVGAGVLLAGATGVFTAYSALQPELQRIQEERENKGFGTQHAAGTASTSASTATDDRAISRAILSDLKEAKESVTTVEKGSFAWGIRRWLKGESLNETPSSSTPNKT